MKTPFTSEEFFKVIENYNTFFFPLQLVFIVLTLIALWFIAKKIKQQRRLVHVILAFFWIWMGIAYHWIFFSSINPAAYGFAILFVVQGLFFFVSGFSKRNKWDYQLEKGTRSTLALVLIAFAIVIYPLIGYLIGEPVAEVPSMGLPCPTTIFTFGVLIARKGRFPFYLLVIPLLWSLIGFTAALKFGVYQDIFLPVSAIMALVFLRRTKTITR